VNQYDAPVIAFTQESNNLNVHKSDLIQVHEYANAVIVYLSPYVADISRLNSTTEPQGCNVSIRLLFNPQHWQLPLYQLFMGCWIRKSAFLRYPGVHDECHLQAIEENGGYMILDDAFSTNGENSTNCLARPIRNPRSQRPCAMSLLSNCSKHGSHLRGMAQYDSWYAGRSLIG
jgi:hypothetical protein